MLGPATHQSVAWPPLRWVPDHPYHSIITLKDDPVFSMASIERDDHAHLHVLPEPLLLASSAISGYAAADHDRAASGGDGGITA